MKRLPKLPLAVVATASVLFLAGCSSGDDGSSTAAGTGGASPAASCPTVSTPSSADEGIVTAVRSAQLPAGTTVDDVQTGYNIDDRAKSDVIVRICAPGVLGDQLKDTATLIARAIKESPSSDSVVSLRVTNLAGGDNPLAKVRCEDFGSRTFSTEADPGAVRTSWKYPNES